MADSEDGEGHTPSCSSQDYGKRVRSCDCCGILNTMNVTIDSAGRIVVPKPLRQALGLKPGQRLEIRTGDGCIEIEIASTRCGSRSGVKALLRFRMPNCPHSQAS